VSVISPAIIAELHAEPALWHLQSYSDIDATVQAAEAERDALARRVEALRAALEYVTNPPAFSTAIDILLDVRGHVRAFLAADDAARKAASDG